MFGKDQRFIDHRKCKVRTTLFIQEEEHERNIIEMMQLG